MCELQEITASATLLGQTVFIFYFYSVNMAFVHVCAWCLWEGKLHKNQSYYVRILKKVKKYYLLRFYNSNFRDFGNIWGNNLITPRFCTKTYSVLKQDSIYQLTLIIMIEFFFISIFNLQSCFHLSFISYIMAMHTMCQFRFPFTYLLLCFFPH